MGTSCRLIMAVPYLHHGYVPLFRSVTSLRLSGLRKHARVPIFLACTGLQHTATQSIDRPIPVGTRIIRGILVAPGRDTGSSIEVALQGAAQ